MSTVCSRSSAPSSLLRRVAVGALLLIGAPAAFAHPGHGDIQGFISGFAHPWNGLDHVLAMLAVGIWAAQMGGRKSWALPLTFPLLMLAGGAMGMSGLGLPGVEIGIALSALLLGALVLLAARPTMGFAAPLVGIFALFHGHAHGAELPVGVDALMYCGGFVLATAMLHGLGLLLGSLHRWKSGALALRGAGGVIAAAGATLLAQMFI
ncbi:MAG TPA: HupE/UreJ family protein [Dongiaceae bacterium]|nr:HupE/UreJ family protein [Dongiaceae bacterium]